MQVVFARTCFLLVLGSWTCFILCCVIGIPCWVGVASVGECAVVGGFSVLWWCHYFLSG